MATWPLLSGPLKTVNQPRAASTFSFTTITASATPHTKGPWTELVASTSDEATLAIVWPANTFVSATNTSILLDIGIGSAGNEVVVIPDIGVGYRQPAGSGEFLIEQPFLVYIPAGSRVSARCQSVIGSKTVGVCLDLFGGSGPVEDNGPISRVTAYGADAATSRGVTVAASAVANVKGSWTLISASTANPIKALAVAAQGNGSTAVTSADTLLDIGIGAVALEAAVWSNVYLRPQSDESFRTAYPMFCPLRFNIPAGSRLTARTSASVGSTAIDVIVYGMD